jgi:hypothetical protein
MPTDLNKVIAKLSDKNVQARIQTAIRKATRSQSDGPAVTE